MTELEKVIAERDDALERLAETREDLDKWHSLASGNGRAAMDNLAEIVDLERQRDDALTRLAAAEAQVGARDVTDDQLRRWIVAMSDWDAGGEDALYEMQDILDQRAALASAAGGAK